MTLAIALDATHCSNNASYVVRFSTDDQAAAYIARKSSTTMFSELDTCPLDAFPLTIAALYPSCEHGMSLSLCAGPGHYPSDDRYDGPTNTLADAHSEWHLLNGATNASCPLDCQAGVDFDYEDAAYAD